MLQIKDSVRKLYDAQQEKKQFDKYYEEVRKKEQLSISNFMFTNLPKGKNSFEIELDEGVGYYTNHMKLNVTRIRTKRVTWLLDKLKQKLGKDTYKDVVDKTYTVNDIQGLIKYLKSCGVDAKKFKKFIDVDETLIIEKSMFSILTQLELIEPKIKSRNVQKTIKKTLTSVLKY